MSGLWPFRQVFAIRLFPYCYIHIGLLCGFGFGHRLAVLGKHDRAVFIGHDNRFGLRFRAVGGRIHVIVNGTQP